MYFKLYNAYLESKNTFLLAQREQGLVDKVILFAEDLCGGTGTACILNAVKHILHVTAKC